LIDLSDAIDLREIKNLKLANQLLKIRRIDKQKRKIKKYNNKIYKHKLKQMLKLNK